MVQLNDAMGKVGNTGWANYLVKTTNDILDNFKQICALAVLYVTKHTESDVIKLTDIGGLKRPAYAAAENKVFPSQGDKVSPLCRQITSVRKLVKVRHKWFRVQKQ